MDNHHIIIGASAAGIGALRTLMRLDPAARITVITDQDTVPYNTCLLADYCAEELSRDEIALIYGAPLPDNVQLLRSTRVVHIIPDEKRIICADGQSFAYTHLLLATGTSAYVPPITGVHDTKGIFTFHRLHDIEAIRAYIRARAPARAIVIGAGLSGLEAADALVALGLQVTVIERAAQLLPGIVTREVSACIARYAHAAGVQNLYATMVERIAARDNGFVRSVITVGGQEIVADMIVIATGVRVNSELARAAGVLMEHSGVMVNEYLQTSIAGIYAAGDITLVKNKITGNLMQTTTWPDAMAQGVIAAHAMAGHPRVYGGIMPYVESAFFGCTVAVGGEYLQVNDGDDTIASEKSYESLSFDERGKLRGFVIIGRDAKRIKELKNGIAVV